MADESIKVPIDGDTNALAHNGVLYNGREFRREQHLPPTPGRNRQLHRRAASETGTATGRRGQRQQTTDRSFSR